MMSEKIKYIRQYFCNHDMVPIKEWKTDCYTDSNYNPDKIVFTTLFKCCKCGRMSVERHEVQAWQMEEEYRDRSKFTLD